MVLLIKFIRSMPMDLPVLKKNLFSVSVAIFILTALSAPLFAEFVFLKDGAVIQGQILSDTKAAITIRDAEKKVKTIPRSEILRILYTQLYMGKVYVQKTDGKSVICYMVDEDQETYTFREDLYKPVEFKLKRDQVLFMARGNPSGLQGEPETDRIDLKWFPPYNPVKKYRLYIRGPGEAKFVRIDEFRGTSYSLKNLKSNTKYVSYVTAIDDTGDESLPSNEFAFSTLNIKPDRPLNLRLDKRTIKQTQIKKGKKVTVEVKKKFLQWDEVKDVDGKIKGYNIYVQQNGKDVKITTVKINEYEIPEDKSVYELRITAVDDKDGESPPSRIRHPRAVKLGVQPLYFVPGGSLAQMFDPGYGGLVSLSFENFFFQHFEWGLSCGVVNLKGSDPDKCDSMKLVPVTIDAGYHYLLTEWLSIMPYAGAGYTYMDINYTSLYVDKNKTATEPFFKAGVMLNFEFEYFHFAAGADYGFIYETSCVKPFYEVYARTGVLFDL